MDSSDDESVLYYLKAAAFFLVRAICGAQYRKFGNAIWKDLRVSWNFYSLSHRIFGFDHAQNKLQLRVSITATMNVFYISFGYYFCNNKQKSRRASILSLKRLVAIYVLIYSIRIWRSCKFKGNSVKTIIRKRL